MVMIKILRLILLSLAITGFTNTYAQPDPAGTQTTQTPPPANSPSSPSIGTRIHSMAHRATNWVKGEAHEINKSIHKHTHKAKKKKKHPSEPKNSSTNSTRHDTET